MDNPYFMKILAKQLQQEFEREARLARLRRLARAGCPGLGDRASEALADILIAAGQALKKRVRGNVSLVRQACAGQAGDSGRQPNRNQPII